VEGKATLFLVRQAASSFIFITRLSCDSGRFIALVHLAGGVVNTSHFFIFSSLFLLFPHS
jgi:hypothetical protein